MAVTDAILSAYEQTRNERGVIADPFVGGGIVAFAALSRGYRVYAQDVNSWAANGLATTLRLPPPDELFEAAREVEVRLRALLNRGYRTTLTDGCSGWVTHTLRVAAVTCPGCGRERRLYPYALASLTKRKDAGGTEAFLACRRGHLFRATAEQRCRCPRCGEWVDPREKYLAGRRSECPECGKEHSLAELMRQGVTWIPVLVQRVARRQRELSQPSSAETTQAAHERWSPRRKLGPIPDGVETRVLRRHGFDAWESLYPARQRVVLESLLRAIGELDVAEPVLAALHLAAVGVSETAGHVSRWDRWYLKNYETMALHRFNLTTLSAEPNVWGAFGYGRGTFSQRVKALAKASDWLREEMGCSLVVEGPWDSGGPRTNMSPNVAARVAVGSSERMLLPDSAVDLVLTDPPYHDDVQYGELSLPLRAWAKLGVHDAKSDAAVNRVNGNGGDEDSYRLALSKLFAETHRILDPDGRFVFSYANKEPRAWIALFQALEDAGFRAVAYEIVHAENETGPWKNGMTSCDSDLLLEVVPRRRGANGGGPATRRRPAGDGDEKSFLRAVGEQFLRVGSLGDDWQDGFKRQLLASPFLSKPAPTEEHS